MAGHLCFIMRLWISWIRGCLRGKAGGYMVTKSATSKKWQNKTRDLGACRCTRKHDHFLRDSRPCKFWISLMSLRKTKSPVSTHVLLHTVTASTSFNQEHNKRGSLFLGFFLFPFAVALKKGFLSLRKTNRIHWHLTRLVLNRSNRGVLQIRPLATDYPFSPSLSYWPVKLSRMLQLSSILTVQKKQKVLNMGGTLWERGLSYRK